MIELPTSFLESHSSNSLTRKDVERLGSTLCISSSRRRRSTFAVLRVSFSLVIHTSHLRRASCRVHFFGIHEYTIELPKKNAALARRDVAGLYLIRVRPVTIGFHESFCALTMLPALGRGVWTRSAGASRSDHDDGAVEKGRTCARRCDELRLVWTVTTH